jgi:hydroxymethylpyrimidine/phosphomethylpyrimidine kinase
MRGRMDMDKTILVIAGSDSCAGAGLEIDLKCAAAHGVHATCAVTAVTAQNTCEVIAIQPVDPQVVRSQIKAACADMPPAAVKIGMLGNADIAEVVADELVAYPKLPVVLDPVLVATVGATLTDASVFELVRDTLIPRATVVTPNIPEAAKLTGVDIVDAKSMGRAAQILLDAGAHAVLIKGGHGCDDVLVDRLYADGGVHEYASKRLPGEYHGTGCALSTAIVCNLACGIDLEDAVREGHDFIARALAQPLDLGQGTRVFDPLRASCVWKRADS